MHVITLPPQVLEGALDLGAAFELVFGERTLRQVHGASLRLHEWKRDESAEARHGSGAAIQHRRLAFRIDVPSVPAPVRRFFCGSSLRISVKQVATFSCRAADWDHSGVEAPPPDQVEVRNRTRMHFLGAEMVRVKPSFRIFRDPDASEPRYMMEGRVEHHALLPPPLNGIVEMFMAEQSAAKLTLYARAFGCDVTVI